MKLPSCMTRQLAYFPPSTLNQQLFMWQHQTFAPHGSNPTCLGHQCWNNCISITHLGHRYLLINIDEKLLNGHQTFANQFMVNSDALLASTEQNTRKMKHCQHARPNLQPNAALPERSHLMSPHNNNDQWTPSGETLSLKDCWECNRCCACRSPA